jgi:hypothetical protein
MRCNCVSSCDCFLLDDGYNGTNIINNDTTYIRGIGEFFSPYSIDNIHDPNFIPPIAKARKNSGFVTSGAPVYFDSADFNTEGMFNPNNPNRISILHQGLYAVGFDVSLELNLNTSLPVFTYNPGIVHVFAGGGNCVELEHNYFETTTIWPLTVRSTQSKVSPTYCNVGDSFLLGVNYTPGLVNTISATMWVCYI